VPTADYAEDTMPSDTAKFAPLPTPETAPFWDGCANGELRLQRCVHCVEVYFPPRPMCPKCWSTDVEWETVSGRGTLHSYVINYRPAPGFAEDAPYAIALVQLDEGPRLMSNIVDIDNVPEKLVLDMPLEVTFEQRGEITIPQFRPIGGH
jgi:uncharacterized OB-fold protein